MIKKISLLSAIAALSASLASCAHYEPQAGSASIKQNGYGNRAATCAQLKQKLRSHGYTNTDVVTMKDSQVATTIQAYKANGCEK